MTDPTNTLPTPYQSGMLKPCPFCGGEPYLAKRALQYDMDSDPVTWYGYGCKLCKVQFGCYNDTIEQAREQWNRRVGE